jgi:hypothetical protein
MNGSDRIRLEVEARHIEHVLHFTQINNLRRIAADGLLCRDALRSSGNTVCGSSGERWDGNDDAISLSLSAINQRMFKFKTHGREHLGWAVLLLDRSVLWTRRCRYYPENASKGWMKKQARRGILERPDAFFDMFSDAEHRSKYGIPDHLPTSKGAEVQVLEPIEQRYILGAWVDHPRWVERVRADLAPLPHPGFEVRLGDFSGDCPFENWGLLRLEARREAMEIYNEFAPDDSGEDVYLCKDLTVSRDGTFST